MNESLLDHVCGNVVGVQVVDLQTQVEPVVDEVIAVVDVADEGGHLPHAPVRAQRAFPELFILIEGKGVEDGGDALVQELALAFLQGELKVEPRRGPGQDELLNAVGVDVEKARQHIAAVRVDDTAGALRYFVLDAADAVVGKDENLAVLHAVRQDQASVFDGDHVAPPSFTAGNRRAAACRPAGGLRGSGPSGPFQ